MSGRPCDPWRDVDGVHIADLCRVEQIAAPPAARDQRARPDWRWPVTVRWGLSPLDLRHHAVDESRDQPRGAVRAECGHLLVMSTWLSEEPE